VHTILDEPSKEALAAWQPGQPVERRVRVLVMPGAELTMIELVVSVTSGEVVGRQVIEACDRP